MYCHDAGVIETCSRPRLTQKAFGFFGRELAFAGQLDGHRAIQFAVVRGPDFPEGTDSNPVDQLKMAECPVLDSGARDRLVRQQVERTATAGTGHIAQPLVINHFDRIAAVWAVDVHGKDSPNTGRSVAASPRRQPFSAMSPAASRHSSPNQPAALLAAAAERLLCELGRLPTSMRCSCSKQKHPLFSIGICVGVHRTGQRGMPPDITAGSPHPSAADRRR